MQHDQPFGRTLLIAFLVLCLGEIAIVFGFSIADARIQRSWLTYVSRRDGGHYVDIAEHGYSFSVTEQSNVAFFPLFPLSIRACSQLTGWDSRLSGWILSHLFLFGVFVTTMRYLSLRLAAESTVSRQRLIALTLLLISLAPHGFFFRAVYSESLFSFLFVLLLLSIESRSRPFLCAVVCGLATATRPVGVSLIPITLLYGLQYYHENDHRFLIRRVLGLTLVSTSGLLLYMAHLQFEFGAPLVFIQTQDHWYARALFGWQDKAASLVSLEPIWSVYVPDSIAYWRQPNLSSPVYAMTNLQFLNPLVFVTTSVAIFYGALQGWLNRSEVLASVLLILIPYVTRAYEMSFNSQARFCGVIIPVYIVFARVLSSRSTFIRVLALAFCFSGLAMFAHQFAEDFMFY